MNTVLKKTAPHFMVLLLFLGIAVVYFLPQLQGKVVQQSDVIQYRGMTQEIIEFQEQSGEKPLWTNSMFGGMPAYQINTPNKGNFLGYIDRMLRLGIDHPIGRFLVAMLSFYILMVVLGVNHWLAAIGAIAFAFTTNNFTLYEAGHLTKLRAISYFPLVGAGLILAYRGQYIWGGLLFAAGLGLNILANHVQMTYYLALTLPFYALAELVRDVQRKQLPHFLKASGVLVIGGLLAIGASTANLWTTYEYSKDTMRGEPILAPEASAQPRAQIASSSETEGLSWDYAMQWSNGLIDLFASFIPGVAGGGSGERLESDDATFQDLRRKGIADPSQFPAPLYWGELPFTSGPIYFGAVIFFLFLLGLILVEGPVRWWAGLGVLLTMLLSLGKNLEWFNEIFYYYVPLYNKFRTPNSVLAITSFLIPLLGILAMHRIFTAELGRREIIRAIAIAGGITGGISLFFALLGPSFFAFTAPGDAQLEQAGWDMNAVIADRQAYMRGDAFRSFALIAAAAALLWAFVQDKIKRPYLLAGLGLLTTFDLWQVDRRYVNYDSFIEQREEEAVFTPRPVDQQILEDTDPNYRVFDLTQSPFQSAQYAYFHNMIGGYHAAKLQRYQDIIDQHLVNGNQAVLNMLNTRYIINRGGDGQAVVQRNPGALGNAWFVDAIRLVATPNEEINALSTFDPDSLAIVHEEFSDYVAGLDPGRAGSIELTDYRPDHLVYQANAAGETLAVFSEIWYGPDKGWQAYIDGEPVDHIRANYVLRALRLPTGQHEIEFIFRPQAFYTGRTLSRLFSSVILLGILGLGGYQGYRYVQQLPEEPAPEPKPQEKKRSAARAPRKKKGRKKRR